MGEFEFRISVMVYVFENLRRWLTCESVFIQKNWKRTLLLMYIEMKVFISVQQNVQSYALRGNVQRFE